MVSGIRRPTARRTCRRQALLDCEKSIHQANSESSTGTGKKGPLPRSCTGEFDVRYPQIRRGPENRPWIVRGRFRCLGVSIGIHRSDAQRSFGAIWQYRRSYPRRARRPRGYRAPHHSSSSHSSRSDKDNSDDDAANHKDGKGIKSSNGDNSGGNGSKGSGNSQSAASNTPPPSKGGSGGGSSGGAAPSKPSDDMPAFQPSR